MQLVLFYFCFICQIWIPGVILVVFHWYLISLSLSYWIFSVTLSILLLSCAWLLQVHPAIDLHSRSHLRYVHYYFFSWCKNFLLKLQFNVTFKGASTTNSFFPMVRFMWASLLASCFRIVLCILQSGFKLFTSPQDYGEKVIAKIAEFNATVDQVSFIPIHGMVVYCLVQILFITHRNWRRVSWQD